MTTKDVKSFIKINWPVVLSLWAPLAIFFYFMSEKIDDLGEAREVRITQTIQE